MPEDIANVEISPEAAHRLLGSAPHTEDTLGRVTRAYLGALRPSHNGGDDPEPGPRPDPGPPPAVSTPDIGFQFSPCPPDLQQNALISAIRDALNQPAADVRQLCLNGTYRIGVWLRASTGEADSAARDRGIQSLNLLKGGETFAAFVNSTMIRQNAVDVWNKVPKRLNGDGNPDPGGPTHLTGFSVSFESPNRVVTRIDGFDERPWPDVDFHVIITDTLSVSAAELQCSHEQKTDADNSWLNTLTGIFTGLGLILSNAFFLPAAVFLGEDIIVSSVSAPDVHTGGAGCGAVALFPKEILLRSIPILGTLMVVPRYSRLEVSGGGIFAGGTYELITPAQGAWLRFSSPPGDAIIGGQISDTPYSVYVGRAYDNGNVHPGKVAYYDGRWSCFIGNGGQEERCEEYDIFLGDPALFSWSTAVTNEVPQNAVVGGHIADTPYPVYVARAYHNDNAHPGKLAFYDGRWSCFIGNGGREERYETYEVLCRK